MMWWSTETNSAALFDSIEETKFILRPPIIDQAMPDETGRNSSRKGRLTARPLAGTLPILSPAGHSCQALQAASLQFDAERKHCDSLLRRSLTPI
jgi:hypothetical protein